jgi:hypothetical protein
VGEAGISQGVGPEALAAMNRRSNEASARARASQMAAVGEGDSDCRIEYDNLRKILS